MTLKFYMLTILFVFSITGEGQSYHFSQLYSTPLLNNPAFTGDIEGPFRIAANFRSQWVQGNNPYITNSLSADYSPLRDRIREGSKIGVGLVFTNDQSSGGALQVNSLGFSVAYNLPLDADQFHKLGVGLQGTYHQRRIDLSKLSFENQFGSNGYDPSLPIGEYINVNTKNYMDMNVGIKYDYSADYKGFFGSIGAYNVLQHKDNIMPEEFRMPVRYSLLGGGHFDVGYDGTVYFSINHMYQANARETTMGAAYGLQLGTENKQEIDFGLWYRWNDAIIPYIGYQLNNIQAGLSYDYTISSLKTASIVRNGFELSFVYTAKNNSDLKRTVPWY